MRPSRVLIAAAALVAATAPPAYGSAYSQVLHTYETTGSIPPCKFTSAQLSSALKGVDTYSAQYFADFTSAIQSALAARASGACLPGAQTGATARQPSQGTAGTPRLPAVTAPTSSGIPLTLLLIGAFAALLAVGATLLTVARVRGWAPGWTVEWRHAWDEAGYRAGGSWSEFVDWLRERG